MLLLLLGHTEFDPENVDYGASASAGRDLDAGRADYLQVG